MSKEVKGIFVILIGTIVLIVVSALFIEYVNVSIYSIELKNDTRMACNKALVYFAQETYKERDSSGSKAGTTTFPDIVDSAGSIYISGNIYPGTDVETIYKKLYGDGSVRTDFVKWYTDPRYRLNTIKTWSALESMMKLLNPDIGLDGFKVTDLASFDDWYKDPGHSALGIDNALELYNSELTEYTKYLVAKNYVETYTTPLNMGIPYMDQETVTKIFRWNLAQILSNCDSDNIISGDGTTYVRRNGFKIYVQEANINVQYKFLDLTNSNDKKEFKQITNMNPDKFEFAVNSVDGYKTPLIELQEMSEADKKRDERSFVCLVTVRYEIPVAYEGITPMRFIYKASWNSKVRGFNENTPEANGNEFDTNQRANLTGGGFTTNSNVPEGTLPVANKVVYYLVR